MLAFFLGYIALCIVFATLAPVLLEGSLYLIGYMLLAFWVAIKFIAKALAFVVVFAARGVLWLLARLARGVLWVLVRLGRGTWAACVFLFFLIDEWRRGPEAHPDDAGPDEYAGDDAGGPDNQDGQDDQERAYEDALSLLGLAPGFSRTALHSAWKAAIRKAHPDAGGDARQATAINVARDLIAARHGWK